MTVQLSFIDRQVGSRVRSLRDAAGVSAHEAALLVGSTLADYRRLEAGELRFKARQLIELAEKFGVNGAAFFEEVEVPDGPSHRHSNVTPLFAVLH